VLISIWVKTTLSLNLIEASSRPHNILIIIHGLSSSAELSRLHHEYLLQLIMQLILLRIILFIGPSIIAEGKPAGIILVTAAEVLSSSLLALFAASELLSLGVLLAIVLFGLLLDILTSVIEEVVLVLWWSWRSILLSWDKALRSHVVASVLILLWIVLGLEFLLVCQVLLILRLLLSCILIVELLALSGSLVKLRLVPSR
jgi:hypothetical protein